MQQMFSWLLSQKKSIITEVMVLACLEVKGCLFIESVGYILVKLELFTKPPRDIGQTSFQVRFREKEKSCWHHHGSGLKYSSSLQRTEQQ